MMLHARPPFSYDDAYKLLDDSRYQKYNSEHAIPAAKVHSFVKGALDEIGLLNRRLQELHLREIAQFGT